MHARYAGLALPLALTSQCAEGALVGRQLITQLGGTGSRCTESYPPARAYERAHAEVGKQCHEQRRSNRLLPAAGILRVGHEPSRSRWSGAADLCSQCCNVVVYSYAQRPGLCSSSASFGNKRELREIFCALFTYLPSPCRPTTYV